MGQHRPPAEQSYPLKVFYDGNCRVCAKEIDVYRAKADSGRLIFVDIADTDFNANDYGRTDKEFQAELHVCDAEGQFFTGVDAFRKIWEALSSPLYPALAKLTGLPGINDAARSGYALFARYRHLLPQTNRSNK